MPDEVVKVGVFVNEKTEEIKRVMEYCTLDMIQLHGDESPELCRQFSSSIVIKAIDLKNDDDLKTLVAMVSRLFWPTVAMLDFTEAPAKKPTGN